MPAVRVTSDDIPVPTLVEGLSRDRTDAIQSSITASHPDVTGLAAIIFAAIYERSDIRAGSRVWTIMLEYTSVRIHSDVAAIWPTPSVLHIYFNSVR